MATREQRADIEKKYFPTLSARVLPEMLVEMLSSVTIKLRQRMNKVLDNTPTGQQHCQYLVAFNPNRRRP